MEAWLFRQGRKSLSFCTHNHQSCMLEQSLRPVHWARQLVRGIFNWPIRKGFSEVLLDGWNQMLVWDDGRGGGMRRSACIWTASPTDTTSYSAGT